MNSGGLVRVEAFYPCLKAKDRDNELQTEKNWFCFTFSWFFFDNKKVLVDSLVASLSHLLPLKIQNSDSLVAVCMY